MGISRSFYPRNIFFRQNSLCVTSPPLEITQCRTHSIHNEQQCVLLILQYSIFSQISMTILYFTHIKAIPLRIAWPLASSFEIPWLVHTPLDRTTIDFFICTIFVTPHPELHFQPGFNHYPLLRLYKIVYNEYRAANSSESSCWSLCTEGVLHCVISRGGCYTKWILTIFY